MTRISSRLVSGVVVVIGLVASGLLIHAQLLQPVGTWVPIGAIEDARSNAATVTLADKRTLVAGGRLADASPTDTVVIYDGSTGTFTSAGVLGAARVDAAAALLADGRVLVTGGMVDGAVSVDVELFDPSTGSSTLVGTMARPRARHASATLPDGTVLIVGGATSDGSPLDTAEIFDPATGTTALVGSLTTPRAGASATTLIDGRVLIAGGNDGTTDLATAEIYDPFAPNPFALLDTQLSVARSGHSAILLPNNASVLIAGGTAAGSPVAASDLFLPPIFPDPFSIGFGEFAANSSLTVPRSNAFSGPVSDGYAYVAGGGSPDWEAYRFATIKTDKDDYAPGEFAIITGSGWQPDTDVTLLFQEDPAVHPDYQLTVRSDSAGNIYWDQWAPEQHDLNVRFYLMASDSTSRAQTTFTDANSSLTFSIGPLSVAPGATLNWSSSATCGGPASGSNSCSNGGSSIGGPAADGYTVNVVQQSANVCNFTSKATRATTTTSGGSASGSFAAPETPGMYCYRAEHPSQNIGGVQWPSANSTAFVIAVIAANTAPSVGATYSSVTVDEGTTATNGGSYSDSNSGDDVTITASIGTVTKTGTNTGTWSWSFDTIDDDAQTVTITANDGHGGETTTTFDLTVGNVAPAVAAPSFTPDSPVNEGTSVTISASFSDPGADTHTCSVAFGDGHSAAGTVLEAVGNPTTGTCTALHTYEDDSAASTFTVTVTVTDDNTGVGSNSAALDVNNVAPTISLTGAANVAEGAPYSITLGSVDDPGADTVSGYTIHWGDGASETGSGSPSGVMTHTYADGPNGYTITLDLTDEDGTHVGAGATALTVDNVAPTISLSGASSVAEGSVYSLSLGPVVDPGTDTVSAYAIHWGDGVTETGSGSPSGLKTHTYADGPNNYTITIDLTDEDGTHIGAGAKALTVDNVAPTISLSGASSVAEGSPYSLGLGSVVDPGTDAVTGYTINWGDGSSDTFSGSPNGLTKTHTYADGPNNHTITIDLTDEDGTHAGAGTKALTVNNVAPTLSITAPVDGQLFAVPATVNLTSSFFDPSAADTHDCSIDWDDESATAGTVGGTWPNETCTGAHVFLAAGVYTIEVTVTDDDGGSDTKSVMIVVYDPSAGFVTGGGWIMSPTGAYMADPTLVGKAHFGFVSKYQKGATTPTGQTEFQFQAGNLNFHSDQYQWLVVSGAKAQYKGTGRLNGVPGYDFLLTATDGQLSGGGGFDKFRIKITLNGAVVYDNVPGGSEDVDSANPQIVNGGSIVIHAKK